jgi:dihydroorotase
MVPPLRSTEDARVLWRSVLRDEIDMVASDHAPHSIEEKTASDIWAVKPGIPGLETTLPLLLTKTNHGQISLTRIVRLLAEHPAKVFGLERKGRLAVAMDGDIVLIDPKERFKIDSSKFYSKAHFSAFDGTRCVGRPVTTIVSGHVVYDRGEIIERNKGKVTTREVRVRDSSSTAC